MTTGDPASPMTCQRVYYVLHGTGYRWLCCAKHFTNATQASQHLVTQHALSWEAAVAQVQALFDQARPARKRAQGSAQMITCE